VVGSGLGREKKKAERGLTKRGEYFMGEMGGIRGVILTRIVEILIRDTDCSGHSWESNSRGTPKKDVP